MRRLFPMCLGEFIGTFILVFFGIGVVAGSVIFNAFAGLFQVALAWGLGVTLAIYVTRHLSCAHLNPAVSLGMVIAGRMKACLLPWYMVSQLLGGIACTNKWSTRPVRSGEQHREGKSRIGTYGHDVW